jgi:uncharacterized OB-fold protein
MAGDPFEVPSSTDVPWVPPVADTFSQAWWDACRARRLLVRRCDDCGALHFPPRRACPTCWSERVDWHEVRGHGSLYSYSVVRENDLPAFRDAVPYVVAVIELEEGPRLMSTVVDSAAATVTVDAPVEVVFVDRGEWTFPAFRVR